MMDYLSCGCPDVSYHGRRAWFGDFENYSRSVGVLYAGDYMEKDSQGKGGDDYFYIAYNMHWMPHETALPALSFACLDLHLRSLYDKNHKIPSGNT